jgi:hypothetical protein
MIRMNIHIFIFSSNSVHFLILHLQMQIACLTNDTKRIKEAVAAIKMRLKTGHGKSRVLGASFPARFKITCLLMHPQPSSSPIAACERVAVPFTPLLPLRFSLDW